MRDAATQRLLDTSLEFVLPLRMGDGYREAAFQELCTALREWTQVWEKAESFPRDAVAEMIDLFPAILACAEFYSDSEKARITESAYLVLDLMTTAVCGRAPEDPYS